MKASIAFAIGALLSATGVAAAGPGTDFTFYGGLDGTGDVVDEDIDPGTYEDTGCIFGTINSYVRDSAIDLINNDYCLYFYKKGTCDQVTEMHYVEGGILDRAKNLDETAKAATVRKGYCPPDGVLPKGFLYEYDEDGERTNVEDAPATTSAF